MSTCVLDVARTLNRLQTGVGHTGKKRHYTTFVARVMKFFVDCGQTIDFEAESKEQLDLGCRSVWMWIGYQMALDRTGIPIVDPTVVQRVNSAEMHWRPIRSAIRSCQQNLIDDFQVAMLITPRWVDKKGIEVITMDRTYMVNESENAFDLALKCGKKRLRSNIRMCIEHFDRMTGGREEVSGLIKQFADELQRDSLPQGLLVFSDDEG